MSNLTLVYPSLFVSYLCLFYNDCFYDMIINKVLGGDSANQ